jgi:hypothetical protein
LGNAAQLSAHSELTQSIKSPEKGRIRAKSENESLSCRLSGGGPSHRRTRLLPKIPVNREKYRENANAFTHQCVQNLDSLGISRFFSAKELIRNRERTGKEQGTQQGLIREITPAAANSNSAASSRREMPFST